MDKTLIIAEAGVNHNGDLSLAKKLIKSAAQAGADFVKFQTFVAEKNISKTAPKADYQVKNDGEKDSQLEMVRKFELSKNDHLALIDECEKNGIKFLSTGFDHESLRLLDELNIPFFKIPSGEVTNYLFLKEVAKYKKPVILSTGMCDLGEIERAIDILLTQGLERSQVTVLHCNTEYPTPMEDVNLRAMLTIKNAFGVSVGYSDHTLGIEVPTAAVAMGATVIEKHFTMDRNLPGPDHKASLEPDELTAMVKAIGNVEKALGSGIKIPSASERKNINIARKSLHAYGDLKKGDRITEGKLIAKRPGTGISPMDIHLVLGKEMLKDVHDDSILDFSDFR